MGKQTVAQTIQEITRRHLTEHNGLLLGEAVSAVGWVNNTVPDCPGIIELPMTDVAGSGFAVGAALAGRRPIFVIRFQDFLILNGSPLIFYAAKSKELHGRGVPLLVRAIAAEAFGPVHSGVLHSIFMHFPGFRVFSPMTPLEYQNAWEDFMSHDDPFIMSEHRTSYLRTEELPDMTVPGADITLYGVSAARFELAEAARLLAEDNIACSTVHIVRLKPLDASSRLTTPLTNSKLGLVVDAGHETAGASQAIACALHEKTGFPVYALGLKDHTKCLCPPLQNKTPDAAKIYEKAKSLLKDTRTRSKR